MDQISSIQSSNLTTIPTDVLFEIATHLDYSSILRLCQVSWSFNHLFGQENASIWRFRYQRDISTSQRPDSGNYRCAYREVIRKFRGESLRDQSLEASSEGYDQWVRRLLNESINYYEVMIMAAQRGHRDIVEMMLTPRRGRDQRLWS